MSSARFDERWHEDQRVIEADLEAVGLLAMSKTWAHANRWTSAVPGVVPEVMLVRFAGTAAKAKRLAAVLQRVGLFDARTEDGWPISEFVESLPKYDRAQAQEAGRKGGHAKQTAKRFATEPLSEPPNGLVGEPLSEPLPTPLSEPPNGSLEPVQTRAHPGAHTQAVPRVPSGPKVPTGPSVPAVPSFDSLRSSSAGAPPTITAQAVVGTWIDAYRANGAEPSRGQIGQVGKLAAELLAGNDSGLVLTAAKAAGAKGYATIDRELGPLVGRRKAAADPFPVWAEE
jgi:hypothetical protein